MQILTTKSFLHAQMDTLLCLCHSTSRFGELFYCIMSFWTFKCSSAVCTEWHRSECSNMPQQTPESCNPKFSEFPSCKINRTKKNVQSKNKCFFCRWFTNVCAKCFYLKKTPYWISNLIKRRWTKYCSIFYCHLPGEVTAHAKYYIAEYFILKKVHLFTTMYIHC